MFNQVSYYCQNNNLPLCLSCAQPPVFSLPQTALTSRSLSPSSALPGDALNSTVDTTFCEGITAAGPEPSSPCLVSHTHSPTDTSQYTQQSTQTDNSKFIWVTNTCWMHTADHPLVLHLCNGANTNRWRSEEESGGAQASWVMVERVHRPHPRPCPPLVGPHRAPCCSSSPSSADTPAWRERVPTSRSRSGSSTAARELQV